MLVREIRALHQLSPFTSLWGKCRKYPHCSRKLRAGETKSKVKRLEGLELGFRIRIYASLNLKLSLAITHWKTVPGNPEKFRCDHMSLRKKAGKMAESQQKGRLLLVCYAVPKGILSHFVSCWKSPRHQTWAKSHLSCLFWQEAGGAFRNHMGLAVLHTPFIVADLPEPRQIPGFDGDLRHRHMKRASPSF